MARKAPRKGGVSRKRPSRKRDYAAEYRARTKGTKAGTAARQAARGHKPPPGKTESQLKIERQDAKIEAFAEQQAALWPGVDTAEDIAEALREQVKEHGMRYLQRIERLIEDMRRRYMAQRGRDKRGRRPGLGINMMELAERYGLPPETFGYH